ncbi:hypothetical protein [Caballeronia grimmiae]
MIHELTLDAPVRYETGFVEFIGGLDERHQAFQVGASVFKELLQVRQI